LLEKIPVQKGQVEFGANVLPLYFDQLRKGIDPEKTIWENVATGGGDNVFINGKARHVISYLQDFLFTSERARTKVKYLSGGERHRLLLARLFTIPSNLLVFDEPTNDLDTETLELLEEVLLNYEGTLIIVSHDREFLNNVVTSALIFTKDGKINEYVGGYDDWERQIANSIESQETMMKPKKEKQPKQNTTVRKISGKEKKELEAIPAAISILEKEQVSIQVQLADLAQCQKHGFVAQSKARLNEIETELALKLKRWEELEVLNKNKV
jgi:ATP-binding cassette subfamily F protein uup